MVGSTFERIDPQLSRNPQPRPQPTLTAFWWLVADALEFAYDCQDSKGCPGNIKHPLYHRGDGAPFHDYGAALSLLTARGYALWDVIKTAEKAGSLDSDIPADAEANNLADFLANNPRQL